MSEARADELEAWVREDLHLGAEVAVRVLERDCAEAGCAPKETAIEVGGPDEDPLVLTIHKPLDDVDRLDVLAAVAFGGH